MATKQVTFCDSCDKAQGEVGAILPTFFVADGKELCYSCASTELRKMYSISGAEVAVVQESAQKLPADKRLEQLRQEQGVDIFIIVPKGEVAKGLVVKHGNPARDVEMIEEVPDGKGHWFVKLVG